MRLEAGPVRRPNWPERARARSRAELGRRWAIAREARREIWFACVAGLLLFSSSVAVIALLPDGRNDDLAGQTVIEQPPKEEEPRPRVILRVIEEAREIQVPAVRSPETAPVDSAVIVAVAILGVVLIILGLRFHGLPAASYRRRRHDAEDRVESNRKRREALEQEAAAAGRALEIHYNLPQREAVSRQAMLDSADVLGRLLREECGTDLAADPTLRRTIAAGGRFSPVM